MIPNARDRGQEWATEVGHGLGRFVGLAVEHGGGAGPCSVGSAGHSSVTEPDRLRRTGPTRREGCRNGSSGPDLTVAVAQTSR